MNWVHASAGLLLATSAVAATTGASAFRQRAVPGRRMFGWTQFAVAMWAATAGLDLLVGALPTRMLLAKLQYLGIASLPVFWFRFAGAYSHRLDALQGGLRGLWIVPVFTVTAAFTNDSHRLLWSAVVPSPDGPDLVFFHGPIFWINWAYAYVLLGWSTWWLIAALAELRGRARYRTQAGLLLAGTLIPWMANLAFVLGFVARGIDITPIAFAASGLCVIIGMLQRP